MKDLGRTERDQQSATPPVTQHDTHQQIAIRERRTEDRSKSAREESHADSPRPHKSNKFGMVFDRLGRKSVRADTEDIARSGYNRDRVTHDVPQPKTTPVQPPNINHSELEGKQGNSPTPELTPIETTDSPLSLTILSEKAPRKIKVPQIGL